MCLPAKMPQENQVLRCFSCATFQVHIVKKVKKWECKICGAKQSFKRHYGKGTGKECRNHVMKLNEVRVKNFCCANLTEVKVVEDAFPESEPVRNEKQSAVSKWAQYLDEDVDGESEETFLKREKRRKIIEEPDEVKKLDTDRCSGGQSNATENNEYSKHPRVEGGVTERKKSKNVFDSNLDNVDDFLSFI